MVTVTVATDGTGDYNVPTGSVNAEVQINQAISSVGGGTVSAPNTVYIKAGTYNISNVIHNNTNHVIIHGDPGQTVLNLTRSLSGTVVFQTTIPTADVIFHSFRLTGANYWNSWFGTIADGNVKIDNLTIRDIIDDSYIMIIFIATGAAGQNVNPYSTGIKIYNITKNHGGIGTILWTDGMEVYNLNQDTSADGITYGANDFDVNRNNHNFSLHNSTLISRWNNNYILRLHGTPTDLHIYNNYIQQLAPVFSAIGLDEGANNIIIERNIIKGVSGTIGLLVENNGGHPSTTIQQNIITGCDRGLELRRNNSNGSTIKVYNNTIFNNKVGIYSNDMSAYSTSIFKNNLVINSTTYGMNLINASNIQFNYNDVYSISGSNYNPALNGINNISVDPLFANPIVGDFHLKSLYGRYDPVTNTWVKDTVHSPCINAGDPTSSYSLEPENINGRIDMGAYGNTPEASYMYAMTTCPSLICNLNISV